MVNTLQNFWLKHRKAIILGSLILLGAFLLPHIVHAADPAPTTGTPDETCSTLLNGLSQIMKFLQRLLWPIIAMIGSLMQNDLLFGSGMEQRLNLVWVNIRDIVNILFVLILLGIALYNVVAPPGQGNYHFKTILPKFVIALIAVNFTFIGIKIVLDGVNVVSTAVFALPSNVECTLKNGTLKNGICDTSTPDPEPKVGLFKVDEANGLCGAIYGGYDLNNPDEKAKYSQAIADAQNGGATTICAAEPEGTPASYLRTQTVSFFAQMNAKNSALVMAISLGRLNLFDKVYVNANNLKCENLALNAIFSVVLYIVYGTAFIALFVALLVRLVALWVMIAISPLMVLPFVLPEKLKSSLGGGDLETKFIKNAIMPIPIALVMSIGYVMLRGLQGAKLAAGNDLINSPSLSLNLLTSGLTSLQELIIAFGTIAFVWIGVFEAFKGTSAQGITDGIKNTVEGFGKTLGKFAVGSIPLFPTKGVDKQGRPVTANISDIGLALKAIPGKIQSEQLEHAKLALPGFMMTQDQAISAIGQSKNWDQLKGNMANVSKNNWGKPFQTQLDTQLKGDKDSKAKMDDIVKKLNYPGGVSKFYTDLKEGNVKPDMMEKIYREMGVTPGSGTEPIKPGEAGKEQAQKAVQNKYSDKANRKKLRDSGMLTDDIATDKQLNDLQTAIDKGKGKPANSPEAKAAEAAAAQLAEIDKKVQAKEAAASGTLGLASDIKVNIQDNTKKGVNVPAGGKVGQPNAENIKAKLKQKVDDLVKSGKSQADAEKQVMAEAANALDNESAAALAPFAGDSLLGKAIEKRNFESSDDFSKNAPLQAAKKAADGAKGKPNEAQAQTAYDNSYAKAKGDWQKKSAPPPPPQNPGYEPQGPVTDVVGKDGVSKWNWDVAKKQWVQKK